MCESLIEGLIACSDNPYLYTMVLTSIGFTVSWKRTYILCAQNSNKIWHVCTYNE